MIAFIAIAAAMLAAACAWVLVPLLKRRPDVALERDATNLSVLRDQRDELEADLANGVIAAEAYEAARIELDRRVLDETISTSASTSPTPSGVVSAVIVAAALPIVAIVLYLVFGTPTALLPEQLASATPSAPAPKLSAQDIEGMIERVKERLAREPNNLEGWIVLARTYYALGRAEEAAKAFERAATLTPNDANLLADYADALGQVQNGSLEGKPAELIARALAIDPKQWKANALAGTLAFAHKDFAKAIDHWQRVQESVPPDSPVAISIAGSIAQARQLAGGPRGESVAGTVSLSPALAGNVSPDDTVFVFARAVDGSRIPVAVVRGKVKDLPLAFSLDDSNAMTPANRLSTHGEVIVGARVSRSGLATPQPGDIETVTGPVKVGASGVSLVIDRKRS
ncbi:MAG TPA: c-type cytochrome biogenesis protein CcmI [Casimicrobiaceae bacterium]|nr:c-type cytochrome biogenesis protein CcmI [Casimicrobiaceae bacterium]